MRRTTFRIRGASASFSTSVVAIAATVSLGFAAMSAEHAQVAISSANQAHVLPASAAANAKPVDNSPAAKAARAKAAKAAKLRAAKLRAAKLRAAKLRAAKLKAEQARAAEAAHAKWLAAHGGVPSAPVTPAPAPVGSTPAAPSTVPSAAPVAFPIVVPPAPAPTATPSDPPTAAPTSSAPTETPTPTPTATPTATPTPTPTPAPTPSTGPVRPGGQPGPNNTGVPAGESLTVFNGDLTANTPGATYSNLDIHGYVLVTAPNVTIKNSIIRGGPGAPGNGIVNDTSLAATNFLIEDSEIVPSFPSVGLDCIKGFNYTALRVNMHGTVDGAKFYGPNATVQSSWIHGLVTYAHDPAQNGGQSHNDGVQVLSGSNMHIIGNTIEGGSNTAIQITQDHGAVTSLTISGNWMSGGKCTVNVANKPLPSLGGITINDNIFINDSTLGCEILDTPVTSLSASGNVFAGTGLAVRVNNNGAA